jgi:hypothetical protein
MIGMAKSLGLALVVGVAAGQALRAAGGPGPGVASAAPVFPQVEGTTLEGRKVQLPRDFDGALNVVLVAFKREQQADVDTWMRTALDLEGDAPRLRVYELPVLGRGYRLLRGFIDGGMRSGIPDAAARARTVTLYIDKTPFKASLGIRTEDRIVVLLVTPAGEVVWRADGAMTAAAAQQLEARAGR